MAYIRFKIASEDFQQFGQSVELPKNSQCYGVYFNYTEQGYDFTIAPEIPNQNMPIIIEDLTWYEKFSTKVELLGETWESINRKGKQGLLKRAFTVDFERYQADGKVDVFVSAVAHC